MRAAVVRQCSERRRAGESLAELTERFGVVPCPNERSSVPAVCAQFDAVSQSLGCKKGPSWTFFSRVSVCAPWRHRTWPSLLPLVKYGVAPGGHACPSPRLKRRCRTPSGGKEHPPRRVPPPPPGKWAAPPTPAWPKVVTSATGRRLARAPEAVAGRAVARPLPLGVPSQPE